MSTHLAVSRPSAAAGLAARCVPPVLNALTVVFCCVVVLSCVAHVSVYSSNSVLLQFGVSSWSLCPLCAFVRSSVTQHKGARGPFNAVHVLWLHRHRCTHWCCCCCWCCVVLHCLCKVSVAAFLHVCRENVHAYSNSCDRTPTNCDIQ